MTKKSGSSISGSGRRQKEVRVKTAYKRKQSSTAWLQRQLNDPYVSEAKARGYRSRAAFKLLEMDEKLKILKPNIMVVDLGCAPGGWAQVAAEKGAKKIVGIDLLPVDSLPGVDFIQLDFMADEAPEKLMAMLGGKADVVMSDMAPNTTGHRSTDHTRIMLLAEAALAFAQDVLKEGGTFICKVFQGGATGDLLKQLKADFKTVKHIKPPASRADSSELYVAATGFRQKL